ncbi:MAG: 3-phosphoshikimate 1-carboxyvinyltransferase [Candidatus Eremiobacteraeota bacterium]|nr:3-phosphoshikimate 1-carboxyvinyltransferase [Candidatus Eremiobacteraeota bacterium]
MAALGAFRTTVEGTIRVPGDKSISHRALILAALAPGMSRITGLQDGADVRATAGALRGLGIPIESADDAVRVTGGALRAPAAPLDCLNSGTTARLLAGVAAAQSLPTRFVGDASLSRRPMARVADPLRRMGAAVTFDGPDARLPMTITGGTLADLDWTSEMASAQVKSAILLAGLLSGAEVVVREPAPSRDHTERMLAARGVSVYVRDGAVLLPAGQQIAPLDTTIPGDPSSAAFFVALAALAARGTITLPNVCLNPTRIGFLDALKRMGAQLDFDDTRHEGGERVGTVVARGGEALHGIEITAAEVPSMIDELPLLACVAACADGETTVRGAAELRVKESDRISRVVENLRALGVAADELPDGFVVRGRAPRPCAGLVHTHGDHRLAMAFGVLGALAGSDVQIDDPASVDVSYPGFWRDLAAVTPRGG